MSQSRADFIAPAPSDFMLLPACWRCRFLPRPRAAQFGSPRQGDPDLCTVGDRCLAPAVGDEQAVEPPGAVAFEFASHSALIERTMNLRPVS
jgi:hypothetical protein